MGTVLGLILVVVLWRSASDPGVKGMLVGAASGCIWMLGRTAWALEKKAQRAQHCIIQVDDDGLYVTDARQQRQTVPWSEVVSAELQGGRLEVTWAQGKIAFGTREIRDGLQLVQEVVRRHHGDSPEGKGAPSNFIPLLPR